MTPLVVFLGGVVGAPLRYVTDRAVTRYAPVLPWGTFVVNVAGSLILGGVLGAAAVLPDSVSALLGTGFCGALTTYSTFGYETLRLVEQRTYLYAAINVGLNVLTCLGAVVLGHTTVLAVLS